MFNKNRIQSLELDLLTQDKFIDDLYEEVSQLKSEARGVQGKTDKLENRLEKIEHRLSLLEEGELQDLENLKRISDAVIHNEKVLNDTLSLAGEGHQGIHTILQALMKYLKVDFNEDGDLEPIKKSKKK